jgi:hypothetical protein
LEDLSSVDLSHKGGRVRGHLTVFGAEDGTRTRDLVLGKDTLYQLSHFRKALTEL